jgi:protein-S-isoprenylcysteine O-methyltransferase Ste14
MAQPRSHFGKNPHQDGKKFMIIAEVEIARKIVLGIVVIIGVLMFALTDARGANGTLAHEIIQWSGIIAILICILGRTWTSLYIGGRKDWEFVTVGPYSVSRNPLYFLSILGAGGAGAQLGSVISGVIFGLLAWMVFYLAVLREEREMGGRYGAEYAAYKASVPRFLPNPRRWRDVESLTVRPTTVLMTFADSMLFLLSPPLADGFEYLQSLGILPVLVRLP